MAQFDVTRKILAKNVVLDDALSIFPTASGWIGILGSNGQIRTLTFGHASPVSVRRAMEGMVELDPDLPESDWSPDLRGRLESFMAGKRDEFHDVRVRLEALTSFQICVLTAARSIGYGRRTTYGGLADIAGFRGAARAVGQVMARNPIPLIIPCHRIVAAGGRLGGFSARSGPEMKRRLLEMERRTLCRKQDGP